MFCKQLLWSGSCGMAGKHWYSYASIFLNLRMKLLNVWNRLQKKLVKSSSYHQMKSIARAYSTSRQCSSQEAVYLLIPELWLRKTFPGVIIANSNVPESRYKLCRGKEEVDELPEDSLDVVKWNMVDRYIDRPNITLKGVRYKVLHNFCYAKFVSFYYLRPSNVKNVSEDSQPFVLVDNLIECNNGTSYYPFNMNSNAQ